MSTIEGKAQSYANNNASHQDDDRIRISLKDAYIAGAKEALAWQWIRVKDRLPEEDGEPFDDNVSLSIKGDFIVYVDFGTSYEISVASRRKFSNDDWRWYDLFGDLDLSGVTHWMQIYVPPKDESE